MRIVSLISSGTEILFGLGLGERVVAVSHECDYPTAVQTLPRATCSLIDSSQTSGQIDEQVKSLAAQGQTLYGIDADLIDRLQPDLIVTQVQCDVCAVRYADVVELVESRPGLRNTRVLALNPQSLGDVLADVRRLGEAAGALEAATRMVERLSERVSRISGALADLPAANRPRVVCIEWIAPLMAAGNWTPELIERAGGRSGLAVAGRHSDYVSWDEIRAYDPEVLFVAPCGFDLVRSQTEAEQLRDLPRFSTLSAVRHGRAYVLDGNAYLNRSGPRLVESLELLACLIHPEMFPPPAGELAEGRAWSRW
jgi:iron complex transport system substrate-binding protein